MTCVCRPAISTLCLILYGVRLQTCNQYTVFNPVWRVSADLHTDLEEWGPVYTLWANSEDQLVSPLHAMATAVETAANALKELVGVIFIYSFCCC